MTVDSGPFTVIVRDHDVIITATVSVTATDYGNDPSHEQLGTNDQKRSRYGHGNVNKTKDQL